MTSLIRVPDRLTVLTPAEAIAALATAYTEIFSRPIDAPTLAILVAKTALETGNWRKIHCNNFGNVKGADPQTGLFTMYRCDERLAPARAQRAIDTANIRADGSGMPNAMLTAKNKDGTWTVMFWPDHEQCKFRAFYSAAAGAVEYIRFLAIDTKPDDGKPNRYAAAWKAADTFDDPKAFAHELKRAGYYTASEASYTAGVVALYNQYLPQCIAYMSSAQEDIVTQVGPAPDRETQPAPREHLDDPLDAERVFGLIALTLDQSSRGEFEGEEPDELA